MNQKLLLAALTLAITANSHAGWLDKLTGSTDKIQEKIEAAKNSDLAGDVKNSLSNEDIITGLKEALNKGAAYAVDNLGKTGGFLNNSNVRIPMPEKLEKVESLLRKSGKEEYADEFVTTMNRAAESAVPLTLGILKKGIADMNIEDAKNILNGPDDAATQYLKKTGSEQLNAQISPIVKEATSRAGVTAVYKKMYDKLGFAGKYLNLQDYNVDAYVTQKTMSGLFTMIAQEEKKIRDNPAARTSEILKTVFGKE